MGKAVDIEVDADEVGMDPSRLARIDQRLARYVDDGRLAGWQVIVSRRGKRVHSSVYGLRDKEAGLPVGQDTLWRIYSMTKPVTSVAAMQLFEEGAFSLNDEVGRYLPEFADMRVFRGGTAEAPKTVPATEPIRMWHLLSHCSGLTYGFTRSSVVDEMYRNAGSDFNQKAGVPLAEQCAVWASMPLLFEPGTSWNYSVATDVLGRVLEVLDSKPLDRALSDRVLTPLGMTDTRWWVDEADAGRTAALYVPTPGTGEALRWDPVGAGAFREPALLSGGGGLISTAYDYDRFTQLLLGRGELEGQRLLSPRTLAYMTRNHLPGGKLLTALAPAGQFSETAYDGVGFGLGFSVLVDPVAYKVPASAGEFAWGGAASTAFWIDPVEQVTAAFYTQLLPSSTYAIRTELRQLVYSSIVD
ncbi:MAG: beta-lactamase [Frankiales bacterium]|jgi:CubicO group peptidase (beta-lactamase class C family)|nr:beta-lactamase [Frankiales bacterium]